MAAAVGEMDIIKLRALWPEVILGINRNSKVTHALMETVLVEGVAGTVIQLAISTPSLARMLGDRRHTDVIAAALTELLGGTWTVEVSITGTKPSAAGARAGGAPAVPAVDFAPTTEAPQAEAPRAEAPRAEAPRAEAPRAEAPRAEAPRAEAPRAESLKPPSPEASPKATAENGSVAPVPAAAVSPAEGGWPAVTALPNSAPSAPVRSTKESSKRSSKTKPIGEPTRESGSPANSPSGSANPSSGSKNPSAPPPVDPRDQHPDAYDGESDDETPSTRHDPEAEALALLESGLGARRVIETDA